MYNIGYQDHGIGYLNPDNYSNDQDNMICEICERDLEFFEDSGLCEYCKANQL